MSIAVLGMSKSTPPKRIVKARKIAQSLVDNVIDYKTPDPTCVAILKSATDYEKSYNESRGRDRDKMNIFRSEEIKFMAIMNLVVAYVQVASGGDALIIQKSGLLVKKTPEPPQPLGKVMRLEGWQGSHEGESLLSWDKLKGSKSYVGEKSVDGKIWTDAKCPCTATSVTVTGLVTETYSWFRIAGVNKFGIGEWSDPVRVESK